MHNRLFLGRLVIALCVALPLSAASQDILGIEGTWELDEAADIPAEGTLVFSRFTFTGSHMQTTAVTIDPSNGHLRARTTDDRYIASDGQVIVRAFGNTTVLDVGRVPDGLVVRDTETDITLRFHLAPPTSDIDPALYGRWASNSTGDGAWTVWFGDAGRARLARDGKEKDVAYTIAGPYLLIDKEPYRYTFVSGHLELEHGDDVSQLTRTDT